MAARKGIVAAKAADKAKKPSWDKPDYLTLSKDGEKIVIRFLNDGHDWDFVDTHSFVPTRGPADEWTDEQKKNYPTRNGAVCRNDEMFRPDGEREFEDCYICKFKKKDNGKPYNASVRVWALAVVREPIIGTQKMADANKIKPHRVGKVVGYKDAMVEVDERDADGQTTGNKITRPKIVIVNYGMKNFFTAMQGYYQAYEGTVTDRDFVVVREGTETDTNYAISGLDKTPNYDTSDPEVAEKYAKWLPDVDQLIRDRASDDYYAYFFDERVPHPERKGKKDDEDDDDKPVAKSTSTTKATTKKAAPEPAAEKGDNGVPADRLAAMSAEVRGRYGRKKTAPEAAAEEPAAEDVSEEAADEPENTSPAADESEESDDESMALTG